MMKNSLPRYARIVPELSLDRAFDYEIPEELQSKIRLGSKVKVPFRSRVLVGFVLEFPNRPEVEKTKMILEVVGKEGYLPESLLKMAAWMKSYYCASLGSVLMTMMPKSVRDVDAKFKERLWVSRVEGISLELVDRELKRSSQQRKAWEFLEARKEDWLSDLTRETGITAAVWRGLEDRGFVSIHSKTEERLPWMEMPTQPFLPLQLHSEQQEALDRILKETQEEQPKPILIQGITGSGKTEVYLQAIHEVIRAGKKAIVLVPEISLTPQTMERFHGRFLGEKARIAVLHSHLSEGERHDQWHQIREGRAQIVVGARSAIFAPISDLGLIVVDEEHESSYKQEESPHYHARDLAVLRGHMERVPVVLGSATPSLESLLRVQEGKYHQVYLRRRAGVESLPTIHVVDLKKDFKKVSQGTKGMKKVSMLSETLIAAIQQRLERKEQTLLFLNRRGYSSSIQCPQCGEVQNCSHCSVSLTFHRKSNRLKCHLCGTDHRMPQVCPSCGFDDYAQSRHGTEKVEEVVAATFPQARICRIDSDTMNTKHALHHALKAVGDREVDILIGTQMIAKGLHFPWVTCVGIIDSDLALQIPDFRASERVFQTLMQVSGRAGRSDLPGEVYIQTRMPFHPAIQFARHHDSEGFYQQEFDFRKVVGFPPYCRSVLIEWRGKHEELVQRVAETQSKEIEEAIGATGEAGNYSPAPIPKVKDRYRFQQFIKSQDHFSLVARLRPLLERFQKSKEIQIRVDVDPYHLS